LVQKKIMHLFFIKTKIDFKKTNHDFIKNKKENNQQQKNSIKMSQTQFESRKKAFRMDCNDFKLACVLEAKFKDIDYEVKVNYDFPSDIHICPGVDDNDFWALRGYRLPSFSAIFNEVKGYFGPDTHNNIKFNTDSSDMEKLWFHKQCLLEKWHAVFDNSDIERTGNSGEDFDYIYTFEFLKKQGFEKAKTQQEFENSHEIIVYAMDLESGDSQGEWQIRTGSCGSKGVQFLSTCMELLDGEIEERNLNKLLEG